MKKLYTSNMLLIRTLNKEVICFLENPKCGSSTLRFYYDCLKQNHEVLFIGNKKIEVCNYVYDDPNYGHVNLKGVHSLLRTFDIQNCISVTTIRNPYDKVLSTYYYDLKKRDHPFYFTPNLMKDIELFLDRDHTKQFRPRNFRYYNEVKITNLLKLENLNNDLENLNKKYNLKLNVIDVRLNVNEKRPSIVLPPNLKDKIFELYKEDFIDGGYPK